MDYTTVMDFLLPPDWVWDRFAELFSNPLQNVWFIIAWALTMVFGIQQYIHATRATKAIGKAPYPFYMHTFYFAHDATWCYTFILAAIKYKTCWWFYLMVLAFFNWTYSEMKVIKMSINNDEERNDIWKNTHPEGISKKEAWKDVWMQIAIGWGVTNVFRIFMGSASLWQWTVVTNMLMQIGPVYYWKTFKSQKDGLGLRGLAIWILACTVYTFSPISAYVVGFPEIFHKPLFYITGVITTIIGIYGVRLAKSIPIENATPGKTQV